jgi:hypothetical protein
MPEMILRIEGEVPPEWRVDEKAYQTELPLRVCTLDHGMASGRPSVAVFVDFFRLGRKETVVAQTSVKLFQLAAAAMLGKYGDQTGTAFASHFSQDTAKITFSEEIKCHECGAGIPSHFKHCHECGVKQ